MLRVLLLFAGLSRLCLAQVPEPASANLPEIVNVSLGSVEGIVVSTAGQPIAYATVFIVPRVPVDKVPNVAPGEPLLTVSPGSKTYIGLTNESGVFKIGEIPAGEYRITGSHQAYFEADSEHAVIVDGALQWVAGGLAMLKLNPGEHKTGFSIALRPKPVMSGRITDQDGKPIRVAISFVARNEQGAYDIQQPAVEFDEEGNYTVRSIPLGERFYVRFALPAVNVDPAALPAFDKAPEAQYVETFYPGVDRLSAAQAVIATENDLRGIDLRLRKGYRFRIRGHLEAWENVADESIVATLIPLDPEQSLTPNGYIEAGAFEFRDVPAGRYLIQVEPYGLKKDEAREHLFVGQEIVAIGDHNVDEVIIRSVPVATMTTQITFDLERNTPAKTPVSRDFRFSLISESRLSMPLGASSDPAGNSKFYPVMPGNYRLHVSYGTGAYIKKTRFQGQDVMDGLLRVGPGANSLLELEVAFTSAQISGSVLGANQSPVPNARVIAFLVKDVYSAFHVLANMTQSNTAGTFTFPKLPPGKYCMVAFQEVDQNLLAVPEFRSRFVTQQNTMEVSDTGAYSVSLEVIPKSRSDAEGAGIR